MYVPAPWPEHTIPLPAQTRHHLVTVLRLGTDTEVTYTDGGGRLGRGSLITAGVARGSEERIDPPASAITIAVAPPNRSERARFLVEKLAELGVDRLVWLDTKRGEGHPPPPTKALAWAAAALEQSQGAFLMELSGPIPPSELDGPVLAAVPGGAGYSDPGGDSTLAVGPEGGWVEGELPSTSVPVGLGDRTLRTETAAVVLAALALDGAGRLALDAK